MAKNRKTKKEKLRSTKRQTSPQTVHPDSVTQPSTASSLYTYAPDTNAHVIAHRSAIAEQTLHLRNDLLRTMTITGAIIFAELLLYVMLLNQ
jgi:hypothetical protein